MRTPSRKTGAVLLAVVIGLGGCASFRPPARAAYHPSHPMPKQEADHQECLAWARERTGYDPATAAAKGGATSGLIFAALGAAGLAALNAAAGGSPGRGAAAGAVLGGLAGGIGGGVAEMTRQHDLYGKHYSVCMRARGYTVE